MSVSAMWTEMIWPRVPVALSERTMTFLRQVADVRQEIEHAVQVARAQVIELQGAGQREGAAVRRNGLDGPLFPLVLQR